MIGAMTGEFAALTDLGQQRQKNQDAALALDLGNSGVLLIVADGVGGAAGGEVASTLTVAATADTMREAAPEDRERALMQAVFDANQAVRQEASLRTELAGMASTIVAAAVTVDGGGPTRVALVHLGDSRAYLFDGTRLVQKTSDHSWVEEQVQNGLLPAEDAPTHPYRHVITRAVGISETVELDTMTTFALAPGSTLLLCTDGLYGPVAPEPLTEVAQRLVDAANAAGGPDNIGIALYRPAPDAV
jgi:protein phosphatase